MNFLTVKNEAGKKPELMIYGDIVDDSWNWGWEDDPNIYPLAIKNMLTGFDGQDIDVHINSGGGHVFAGMAISNMLKQYKGKTTAYVDGIAASAASIIAFGCDDVIIPSNAFLMIHKPTAYVAGDADEMLKAADMLDGIQKGAVATYMSKAVEGVTDKQISDMVDAETWLLGADATEFFNVQISDEVNAINCGGEVLKQYQHTPKLFIKEAKNDETIETMQQEIDIALAL